MHRGRLTTFFMNISLYYCMPAHWDHGALGAAEGSVQMGLAYRLRLESICWREYPLVDLRQSLLPAPHPVT